MARILVQTDDRRTVLLDERSVRPEHIDSEHSAVQLLERLEWAIRDAEVKVDAPRPLRSVRTRRHVPARQSGFKRSFE